MHTRLAKVPTSFVPSWGAGHPLSASTTNRTSKTHPETSRTLDRFCPTTIEPTNAAAIAMYPAIARGSGVIAPLWAAPPVGLTLGPMSGRITASASTASTTASPRASQSRIPPRGVMDASSVPQASDFTCQSDGVQRGQRRMRPRTVRDVDPQVLQSAATLAVRRDQPRGPALAPAQTPRPTSRPSACRSACSAGSGGTTRSGPFRPGACPRRRARTLAVREE